MPISRGVTRKFARSLSRAFVRSAKNNIVPFFLELFSGASAAYSLRQLHSNALFAIRVRRSSDDQEQDIGFTSTGVLDESGLLTFVGSDDGFVVIWYDQSGNNNHASQAVASAQPKLVDAGAVIKENGKPVVNLTTQSEHLVALNISNAIQTAFGVYEFNVLPSQVGFNNSWIWNHFLNENNRFGTFGFKTNDKLVSYQVVNFFNTDLTEGVVITTQEPLLVTNILDDTNTLKSFKNSSEFRSVSAYSLTHGGGDLFIGEFDGSGIHGMVGTISELIFYPSDQSANRPNIEANINNYYSVY